MLFAGERRPVSVANLTRDDGLAFMRIVAETRLAIESTSYSLRDANRALSALRWELDGPRGAQHPLARPVSFGVPASA
jgi:hypothetical protein